MEVGLLLSQNANIPLPTGGNGEQRVDNLRVRRTLLGETGYVLEGHHPNIWKSDKKAKLQVLRKVAKKEASLSEAFSQTFLTCLSRYLVAVQIVRIVDNANTKSVT